MKMKMRMTNRDAERKNMGRGRRKLALALCVMLLALAAFTGCGGDGNGGGSGNADRPLIGIVQIQEHTSLDMIRTSILKQMADDGFIDGQTCDIYYQNAGGEPSNLKTICQQFTAKGCDLIIAIATPSAQVALGETTEIPIVFSAVTDPIEAGVVTSLEQPGGNITGTSDYVSAAQIMDLAAQITPNFKTIGAIYNSGETNSLSVIEDLKAYAVENGLTVVDAPVMNTSEVQQAASSLMGKVDIVYAPIDNTIASNMPVICQALDEAKIPFYVSADSMVMDGGLATIGINYEVLGAETGKMVTKILNGTDPGTIDVMTMKDLNIYVNTDTAKRIGVTFPQDVLDNATVFTDADAAINKTE
ncbi:ABC transporter substrate-binding protein [Bacilliculturomica massiliensis]|uniref:ABC transporter substrate-binding protein n=1 Tax=Bacilliculturomica massiliensis TaxID=1917867 RepID=UPI001FE3A751|nr:ABC transporter substrate-binding protein [Bacilliculturomica massiliensis]